MSLLFSQEGKWKSIFKLIEIQTFIFTYAMGYIQSSQYGANILLLSWKC